ncbi:hypothetical protein LUZ60_003998 [Juncus effusus]|nr:hypothetical protein LUZ60_003998 [Juncus effusus]
MRRFFFFKSSSNSNEDINRTPPLPNRNKNLPEPDHYNGSKTPDGSNSKLRKRYTAEQEISIPHLRRSLSFSSPATYYDLDDRDFHESPLNFQNSNHFTHNCPIHQHLVTPEREEESDQSHSSNNLSISNGSQTSPDRPNRIKNRASQNKYLDVYIEGEQHENQQSSNSSDNTNNKPFFGLRKPPRTRSTVDQKDFESETTVTNVEDIYEDTCAGGPRAFWSNHLSDDSDEVLVLKAKEAEERLRVLAEECFEPDLLRAKGVTVELLFKYIQDLNEERKYIARELYTQIKSRISEGLKSKEKQRISRIELETRTRRLEMERNALQSDLEKDWLTKVNRLQSEEKRLRERVRELAEQNVSLQREVCVLKSKGEKSGMRITDFEAELEKLGNENLELEESLTGFKERFSESEGQLGHFRVCYKEKESENKGLRKVVVRLQRICNEQEKSINSLLNDKNNSNNRDFVDKEILRLTGVECKLRREIEGYRVEMESLRRENVSLLERVKKGNGFKLEGEISTRFEFLEKKCFGLIDESSELNNELLGFVRNFGNNRVDCGNLEEFDLLEYSLKCENVRKGVEGLKRGLHCVKSVLDEKSNNSDNSINKNISTEGEMEVQLKAEVLVNKILREKIFSKEEENEILQEEIANLIRKNDLLQSEIQRLQDELSCLTYKSKDLEIQVVKKDERINQLREELQEAVKELSATRSMLKTVLDERDLNSQEISNLRKINKNLVDNNNFLSKRVESLDEDLLFKEGQISILKDGNKPFLL